MHPDSNLAATGSHGIGHIDQFQSIKWSAPLGPDS
jgi:hypothetical protein